ncbi:MAG: hypothetical protein ACLR23_21850 [Clostridia bacterium]
MTNIYRVLFRQMDESLRDICRAIREYGLKLALFEYVRDETVEVLVYIGSILWTSFRVLTAKTMPLGDALVVINSISTVAFTFQDSIQRLFEFHEHSLYIQNLRYFLEYEPTIQRGSERAACRGLSGTGIPQRLLSLCRAGDRGFASGEFEYTGGRKNRAGWTEWSGKVHHCQAVNAPV